MPLVNMQHMLDHAWRNSYALGAFDLSSLELLEAVIGAAERARAPVILSAVAADPESLATLLAAAETAAQRSHVPVALHCDRGLELADAVRAIRLGCNGVAAEPAMAALPDQIAFTREVAAIAHSCGAFAEGHLDRPQEDALRGSGLTSVAEARVFVERTGVDLLAISLGDAHGGWKSPPKLNFSRLKQLHQALPIPLALHCDISLGDDQSRRLSATGVAKIHCHGLLQYIAARTLRDMAGRGEAGHEEMAAEVRRAVGAEVERLLRLWGCAGRAAEVLMQCDAWEPVEQVILFNPASQDAERTQRLLEHARHVLAGLPGVRAVFQGDALAEGAAYRHALLVRYCHPAALAAAERLPADQLAAGGLSVAYRWTVRACLREAA